MRPPTYDSIRDFCILSPRFKRTCVSFFKSDFQSDRSLLVAGFIRVAGSPYMYAELMQLKEICAIKISEILVQSKSDSRNTKTTEIIETTKSEDSK